MCNENAWAFKTDRKKLSLDRRSDQDTCNREDDCLKEEQVVVLNQGTD